MKQKSKSIISFLLVFVLFMETFISFPIISFAAENNYTNVDDIISDLNNEIGEQDTSNMLKELQEEISKLSNATKEEIKTIIEQIAEEYGVVFSKEQLEKLVDYYYSLIEKDEYGFFENLTNLFKSFWKWLKDLYANSKVSIAPNEKDEKDLIETEENSDMVTVNIPTVKQFDNIVDKSIDKISSYIFPNGVENAMNTKKDDK